MLVIARAPASRGGLDRRLPDRDAEYPRDVGDDRYFAVAET